jgi:hypothetical protein
MDMLDEQKMLVFSFFKIFVRLFLIFLSFPPIYLMKGGGANA